MAKQRLTHRQKTQRAMQAYMEMIDTAEWLKSELRGGFSPGI
jgi:hypothetical protein